MKKTVVESPRIHEQYIRMEHESGLTILLYPMKGFSTAYALFGTKYGSVDNCFKTGDDADFVTVPDGIAHFLEHKLFESEDGDAFTLTLEGSTLHIRVESALQGKVSATLRSFDQEQQITFTGCEAAASMPDDDIYILELTFA